MLLRSDGRFQAHPRFYFFALKTALRNKALRARGYFLKRQDGARNNVAYTSEELFSMGKASFTKIVSAFEHSMVGSAQEKLRQRSDLEALVERNFSCNRVAKNIRVAKIQVVNWWVPDMTQSYRICSAWNFQKHSCQVCLMPLASSTLDTNKLDNQGLDSQLH